MHTDDIGPKRLLFGPRSNVPGQVGGVREKQGAERDAAAIAREDVCRRSPTRRIIKLKGLLGNLPEARARHPNTKPSVKISRQRFALERLLSLNPGARGRLYYPQRRVSIIVDHAKQHGLGLPLVKNTDGLPKMQSRNGLRWVVECHCASPGMMRSPYTKLRKRVQHSPRCRSVGDKKAEHPTPPHSRSIHTTVCSLPSWVMTAAALGTPQPQAALHIRCSTRTTRR